MPSSTIQRTLAEIADLTSTDLTVRTVLIRLGREIDAEFNRSRGIVTETIINETDELDREVQGVEQSLQRLERAVNDLTASYEDFRQRVGDKVHSNANHIALLEAKLHEVVELCTSIAATLDAHDLRMRAIGEALTPKGDQNAGSD
jgi:hypothetical protein